MRYALIRDTLASRTVSENPTSLRYLVRERGEWERGGGYEGLVGQEKQVTVVTATIYTCTVSSNTLYMYHSIEVHMYIHVQCTCTLYILRGPRVYGSIKWSLTLSVFSYFLLSGSQW